MLRQVARIITESIDGIVRRWVDDLRQSARTEVHNNMLTSEIVDSMKSILANVAASIAEGASPGDDTIPISLIAPRKEGDTGGLRQAKAMMTRPLEGPLFAARQASRANGKLRHAQGYALHEVVYEYIRLRQVIWATLRDSEAALNPALSLDLPMYVDRMLDEVMTGAIESFHEASVRDLEKRAVRDPLTQMYNKEFFQQQLHTELRRALRYDEPLTLIMLDMDLLKTVNDTYGHQAGDAVIVAVSKAICETSRQSDIPCRYGGDEFSVILPETNNAQARVFVERVQRAMSKLVVVITLQDPQTPQGEITPSTGPASALPLTIPTPTLSIGLASFPEDGRNPEMLVAKADAALYRAKRSGRNKMSM